MPSRNHVLVGLGRGELLVGRAEHRLERVGPDDQHVLHAGEVELGEVAALAPGAQHQERGVREELLEVAGARLRAGEHAARLRLSAGGDLGHGRLLGLGECTR
jgi:hypothetical protein